MHTRVGVGRCFDLGGGGRHAFSFEIKYRLSLMQSLCTEGPKVSFKLGGGIPQLET